MDPTAISTIAQGTLVTSAVSAFVTGLNGIWRRHPNYGILAGAAAINSGLTAFTFFGIREFAISPLLVSSLSTKEYQRRRRSLEPLSNDIAEQSPVSWGDLRRQKLLDSAVSGALTAGSLRALKTGPKGTLSGAIAGATLQRNRGAETKVHNAAAIITKQASQTYRRQHLGIRTRSVEPRHRQGSRR
ncbi:hypothetical protein BDN71DRAFT_1492845 [Pleurotus eryngii]|uniref:Uncharacterized protein n=1 Tax=Pleurotus eryngii TaxID=5323 RepID=A0A9P6A6H9_PLEER|nr:hypothetical protein BDN71DRAFT_1492845 [Pleurotus eryngii]